MSEKDNGQPGGINLGDIYFVLFRHKWMIILSAVVGLSAAALLLFVVKPPTYRSQTQLQIKYVTENKSPLQPGDGEQTQSLDSFYSLMTTEGIILHSLDLARDVVASIGAEKILAGAGGGTNFDKAAALVKSGLEVEQLNNGNILVVSFQHPDPAIVQEVLNQAIVSYYKRHNEMHQQPVEVSDFQSKETARLRNKLAQLDQELKQAKNKAGVIVTDDSLKDYADRISQIRGKIDDAEADLAGHQALLEQLNQSQPLMVKTNKASLALISEEQVNEYKDVNAHLNQLSKRELELLTQYTPESTLVQEVRQAKLETEKQKIALEQRYPGLAYAVLPAPELGGSPAGTNAINPAMELVQIKALQSKVTILKDQYNRVWAEATNLDTMMTTILDLQQQKEAAENDLKYYATSLARSKIEAAMGDQAAPNISMLESPTPPIKSWSKQFKKKVAMVAAAGVFGGLTLAFVIELVLDTSVKRPGDVAKLRLPLLISIPDTNRNGRRKSPVLLKNTEAGTVAFVGQTGQEGAGWNQANSINRFYTGLRDRLLVYFEVRNITHKPKLVAVTSCHQGAGVTSIAAGLAASLSETGDGNVLLVDMNPEQQVVQQFRKGKLAEGLTSALSPETKNDNLVQEKLYVVTERTENEKQFRHLPKRFSELVPKLKASDYDYIIFDMPPVSPTSVTPRLAGLMDMVLLVIESEKTSQDVVKKVNALLAESKANVSTVLNKTHNYVPARLHQEYLGDA